MLSLVVMLSTDLLASETSVPDMFEVKDPLVISSMLQEAVKPTANEITALAGFCIKTFVESSENSTILPKAKIFINLVHSNACPSPPMKTDEELKPILDGTCDPGDYKVPMSLNNLRQCKDKAGKDSWVVDACINSNTYKRSLTSDQFKFFIVELALTWVEHKNQFVLSRDYSLPKLTHKGVLQSHIIQRAKRPEIIEVETKKDPEAEIDQFENDSTVQKLPKPPVKLMKMFKGGKLFSLAIKIDLHDVANVNGCPLDCEADRLLFHVPKKYFLNLKLPVKVDPCLGDATFDLTTRLLTINLYLE